MALPRMQHGRSHGAELGDDFVEFEVLLLPARTVRGGGLLEA
jgi:hypothetical protein